MVSTQSSKQQDQHDHYRRYRSRFYIIMVCIFISYASLVVGRRAFAFCKPAMLQMEDLDETNLGWITSGFYLTYAISKCFAGIIADSFSSRLFYPVCLFVSSIFCAAFAMSTQFYQLVLFWSLEGLIQGFAWPTCGKLLMHWCQSDELATWWSFLSGSSNVSGLISPILLPIIINSYGWRWCFYGTTLLLVMAAVLNFVCLVDSPIDIGLSQYDGVIQRQANVSPKNKNNEPKKNQDELDDQINWLHIVVYDPLPNFLHLSYMICTFLEKSLIDWTQLYLMQDKNYTEVSAAAAIGSFDIGGITGTLVAGYISDSLLNWRRKDRSEPLSASDRVFFTMFIAGICFIAFLILLLQPSNADMVIVHVSLFFLGCTICGIISLLGVVSMESVPASIAGRSHTVLTLFGNIGGISSGYPVSLVIKMFGWTQVIRLFTGLALVQTVFTISELTY
ncbi:uncharacterized protein TRIADDRAFT_51868 [Trichoplax adhaerens]|uniref:Major facilitator superfamily (MFS) profile domain-containing protein n=1 Tax=Trichoplax adhaerens TaxID=10228 RepID=B3RL40_TRIAD|nr:hypothetical protein TRIADDRAFT_51868 [Trichoplax adhaerens]EDV28695.1 hypothetical protein TRIADDRAFT_51868 [Trichoplax adhaerens]|eukprot:XP_002107897.1 hypothetical protein TRIADDRAFT_51868 [Trichoplax adhaerens]